MGNTEKNYPTLSQYLKESRIRAGLTQKDISKKLGYESPQFISNWERGISSPPLNALKTLIKMYKLNRDDVFEVLLSHTVITVKNDLQKKFYNC